MPNAHLTPLDVRSAFRRIAPLAWGAPTNPTIYGSLEIRAEALERWIAQQRERTGEKITVTHAVVRAVGMILAEQPELNVMVRLGRLYRRRDVDVFAQVAIPSEDRPGRSDLSGLVIRDVPSKDVGAIAQTLRSGASRIREGSDPQFQRQRSQALALPPVLFGVVLKLLQLLQYTFNLDTTPLGAPRDPFGSAMVTSLGMFGVQTAYAPFFPLARVPIIVLVGAVVDKVVVEAGAPAVGRVLTLNGTFDHRVLDGYQAAQFSQRLQALLEHPALLER